MSRIGAATMRTLLVAALLGLTSCASPTPYQPMTDGQGYAQQQLEENRYRVTFSGNTATPRETVENYLLYRAAEVTVERGYDYFVLADNQVERIARAIRGERRGIPEARVREEVVRYGGDVLETLRGWFRPLEVIASLAPLLGLFGTVLGMIEAFRQLE
ncbi:MAG: MotA/TolQ/ExbB proton channel family protein, partial [Acetobacterales bacterium]